MDIIVNKSKVKDANDEEPLIRYIFLIKAPGYFKILKCGKELFKNLDATYERACIKNEKNRYWTEMYDTITN